PRAAAAGGADAAGHRQVPRAPGQARRPPHHHRARPRRLAGQFGRARRRPRAVAPLSRSVSVDFRWPASKSHILKIQAERKRVAVERAMRSPFLRKRMPKVDLERLDDPEVWRKIPVLTKEDLRRRHRAAALLSALGGG